MRPLYRKGVSKHKSAGQFRRNTRRTQGMNLKGAVMRGGIRL